ncbi:histone-lysine N-methyltransferase [Thraustotheca clavata]|uniref:Histone-lysine N-methyltransferase n=1 Tax=Thraustotheca clavata TaxID=74557 RepID=A0A1V9ZX48_9STRA|nr:histone-lysine N-methyltransferase [Thraustotheca clavata]
MQRSCEECRQVVAAGDQAELCCAACRGMFHAPCVRSKRRSKSWQCSKCSGKKPERGLLLAEAVNKIIQGDEDDFEELWDQIQAPPHSSAPSSPLSSLRDDPEEKLSSPTPSRTTENAGAIPLEPLEDDVPIRTNGVCSACGLTTIPEMHIMSCNTCHISTAHTLCMQNINPSRWQCSNCVESIRDQGSRRNARQRIVRPDQVIIPLDEPLDDATVVLCDNCSGEFSMAHLGMREVPSGHWYCVHCDVTSHPDVMDVYQIDSQPVPTPKPARATKKMTKQALKREVVIDLALDDDSDGTVTKAKPGRKRKRDISPASAEPVVPRGKGGKRAPKEIVVPPPATPRKQTTPTSATAKSKKTASKRPKVTKPTTPPPPPPPQSEEDEPEDDPLNEQVARQPLRIVIPEPLTEKPKRIDDTKQLKALHRIVGRSVVVRLHEEEPWAIGEVIAFDPHRILFRVDFKDASQQWLPLHVLPTAVGTNINVFVQMTNDTWWPAQKMELNEVAKLLFPTGKEEMEALVLIYAPAFPTSYQTGDWPHDVCVWAPLASLRCFDMFLQQQQSSNDDPKYREAIQLAYQSNERYIAIVKDAHERLSRNIQKHFQDKRWIGKQVSIVNYDTHSTYTGWITKMEKTNYYWLETDHQANLMVQLPAPSLKSSTHSTCWSWICPLSYVELSMQWFLDPEVILDLKVSPEHPAPQPAPIVDLGMPKDEEAPKCSMCLFPLSSGTLISCTKCNIATHKSCVSPPYQRFPFKDKGGAELIPDLELPYVCADCRTCDGCGLDANDQSSWFVFEARLARVYLCRACSVEYANKQYCPVCYKVYTSGFCADLLQCTSCELWAHCSCEPDPDPVYHQSTPKMNEMSSLAEYATVAAASLLDYTITLPDPNDVCPDDIPTDKLKRKWMDDRFARGLLFDLKYDPRVLAKYECASCRQARFYKLLHSLGVEDKYGLFSQPVTLDIAPTYFDVIKCPMDLSTIAKNVKERKYVHGLGADFRDHFELMCLNAVTFNSKERDFVIWREAWRYYNAGARLLRQLLPSAQLVPNGKYTENILAAAKRQLPTNSAIVAKEDSQSLTGGNGVLLKNKAMDDVQSTPMHSPLPQSGHSTPAPNGAEENKDGQSQASHSAPDSAIVVRSDMYNFQTDLGTVPKPYSCMANVVATLSMAQAHILCWLDACIVCCSTGAHEKMIFCVDCGEAYHQFCLHPPLDLSINELKSTKLQAFWRCPNCKVCELCGTNKEESKLLVCDVCERGCHTFCLSPKLHDVPSTGFVCGNCIDCETCHKSQEMTTWSPSINVCMDCMDEVTKESLTCCRKPRIRHPTGECNVCPGCQKKWSESETLIQCDGCQSWVHPACDNISEEILLSLTEDSEYYCPLCRKKQRKHLKAFRKAWNLQLNIALIQEKRLEISQLWQSQGAYRETMRQYDYWRQFAPVYLYILRLGEECLKALAGRRISFLVQPPTTGISEAMIPVALRQAASRYLRFKRYARGPRASHRRQQRKKQHFFSVEGVEENPKAIAHIVSEAIGAASFLACCTWLYGTKKVSMFTAGLLASHEIPPTLSDTLVEKNAVSVESEVASIKAEYARRRQNRLEEIEARKAREKNAIAAVTTAAASNVTEVKNDPEKLEKPAEPPRKVLEPETPPNKELANMTITQPLRSWTKWDSLGLGDFSDPRMCGMCREFGDDPVSGRLIYADFDQWIHVNCVAWSSEVYEDSYGVLKMCQKARFRSRTNRCAVCNLNGATVGCHGLRCQLNYHFKCSLGHLVFTKGNQAFCTQHDHWRTFLKKSQERKRKLNEDQVQVQVARKRPKTEVLSSPSSENEVEIIGEASAVSVCVRDIVDEIVGSIEHRLDTPALDPTRFLMTEHEPIAKAKRLSKAQLSKGVSYRVGALTVHNLGKIEIGSSAFHTTSTIYPIGYRSTRIFWSAVNDQERCLYECEITTKTLQSGIKQPVFQITPVDDMEHPIQGKTPNEAVNELRRRIIALYETQQVFNTGWNPFSRRKTWFSYGLIGDHFFGLTIPVIGAALEALSTAPTCAIYDPVTNPQPYVFCHTLPTETMFDQARSDVSRQLSIREHAKRSSGSIRTDGYHGWQQSKQIKPLTKQRRVGLSKHADEPVSGNGKPVVDLEQLPIAMQYRELRKRPFHERLEVRKSRIHGYGLFVKEVIAEGKMIVEYQGQAIRQKVADIREKRYEEMGIGSCYMFRLDTDTIVDATRTGNLARFINHSCEPKANARIITIDGNEKKIIIFAKKTLHVGDEVTYDYKFPIEDEAIRCDCGAANCIGRMN